MASIWIYIPPRPSSTGSSPTGLATEATLSAVLAEAQAINTDTDQLALLNLEATQQQVLTAIQAINLTGLATEAKQDVGNISLGNIDTDLDDVKTNQVSQTTILTSIDTTITHIDSDMHSNVSLLGDIKTEQANQSLTLSGISSSLTTLNGAVGGFLGTDITTIRQRLDLTANYAFSYKDESGATDDYYIFQDPGGKYYVMKVAKASTGYATYANVINNNTVLTLADAVSNYLTMTYGEFKDITGGL